MRTTLLIPVAALAIVVSLAGCSLQLPGSSAGPSGSPQSVSSAGAAHSGVTAIDPAGSNGITVQTGSGDGSTLAGSGTGGGVTGPSDAPSASAISPEDGGTGVPADGSRASVILITTDALRAYYGPAGLDSDAYQTWIYSDSPSDVVAGLTRAFGAAPTVSTFSYHYVVGAGTEYSWGGFDLFAGNAGPQGPFAFTYLVDATAATVHGVSVQAGWNLHVGSSTTAVTAVADTTSLEDGTYVGSIDMLQYDAASLGLSIPGGTADAFVLLTATPSGGPITTIDAPMANFGL